MKEGKTLSKDLDACIKCSSCTALCPVASVNPLFPGPKAIGPDAERLRLEGVQFAPEVLEFCSNCKTCEVTCPSAVKITDFIRLARLKSRESRQLKEKWSYRWRAGVLGRAEYIGLLGSSWPALSNMLLRQTWVRALMEKTLRISREAPLPKYQKRFKLSQSQSGFQKPASKQVVYFPGCFASYNDPATAEAVVKVLRFNGFEVIIPEFKCCGVPLEANGQFKAAEQNVNYNLSLLQPYLEKGLPVITACTSCGLALKQDYARIKGEAAELLGLHTYDLFEFLWELHVQGELQENFREVTFNTGYHLPCHLKAQGIGTPSVRVLRMIPGVQIQHIDGGCCGLSGSYGFKSEKYDMAIQIGNHLFEKIRKRVAFGEILDVTTECGVCKTQLRHGTGVEVIHPVWILMKAYGLS